MFGIFILSMSSSAGAWVQHSAINIFEFSFIFFRASTPLMYSSMSPFSFANKTEKDVSLNLLGFFHKLLRRQMSLQLSGLVFYLKVLERQEVLQA